MDKIRQLIKEVVSIDYKDLNFDYYKEILDEIERPYIQIEKAKFEIWKRNNPELFQKKNVEPENSHSSTPNQ